MCGPRPLRPTGHLDGRLVPLADPFDQVLPSVASGASPGRLPSDWPSELASARRPEVSGGRTGLTWQALVDLMGQAAGAKRRVGRRGGADQAARVRVRAAVRGPSRGPAVGSGVKRTAPQTGRRLATPRRVVRAAVAARSLDEPSAGPYPGPPRSGATARRRESGRWARVRVRAARVRVRAASGSASVRGSARAAARPPAA